MNKMKIIYMSIECYERQQSLLERYSILFEAEMKNGVEGEDFFEVSKQIRNIDTSIVGHIKASGKSSVQYANERGNRELQIAFQGHLAEDDSGFFQQRSKNKGTAFSGYNIIFR